LYEGLGVRAYLGSTSFASQIDFTLADYVYYLYVLHGITLLIAFVLSAIVVGGKLLAVKLFEVRRQWQTK
jgi:Na+/serine symporter